MNLILNDNEKSIENNSINSTKEVIENINSLLEDNYILSHVIIDGQAIYTKIEDYIDKNIDEIKVLQVIARTKVEFINDTLFSAEQYIDNAVIELNNLTDAFYQNPSPEDWNQFKHFTDGLKWLATMIANIDSLKERPSNWKEYISRYHQLEENVQALAEALDNQDETLLADIINYEIIPLYEALKQLMTNTIDTEGCRPNAN